MSLEEEEGLVHAWETPPSDIENCAPASGGFIESSSPQKFTFGTVGSAFAQIVKENAKPFVFQLNESKEEVKETKSVVESKRPVAAVLSETGNLPIMCQEIQFIVEEITEKSFRKDLILAEDLERVLFMELACQGAKCGRLMLKPITTSCGHTFCTECFGKGTLPDEKNKDPYCPKCEAPTQVEKNALVDQTISAVKVTCISPSCKWTGKRMDWLAHIQKSCVHCVMLCNWCHKTFPRDQITQHRDKDCMQRIVPCLNYLVCTISTTIGNLPTHLEKECLGRLVHCENKCGSIIAFHSIDQHKTTCPEEVIPCVIGGHPIGSLVSTAAIQNIDSLVDVKEEKKKKKEKEVKKNLGGEGGDKEPHCGHTCKRSQMRIHIIDKDFAEVHAWCFMYKMTTSQIQILDLSRRLQVLEQSKGMTKQDLGPSLRLSLLETIHNKHVPFAKSDGGGGAETSISDLKTMPASPFDPSVYRGPRTITVNIFDDEETSRVMEHLIQEAKILDIRYTDEDVARAVDVLLSTGIVARARNELRNSAEGRIATFSTGQRSIVTPLPHSSLSSSFGTRGVIDPSSSFFHEMDYKDLGINQDGKTDHKYVSDSGDSHHQNIQVYTRAEYDACKVAMQELVDQEVPGAIANLSLFNIFSTAMQTASLDPVFLVADQDGLWEPVRLRYLILNPLPGQEANVMVHVHYFNTLNSCENIPISSGRIRQFPEVHGFGHRHHGTAQWNDVVNWQKYVHDHMLVNNLVDVYIPGRKQVLREFDHPGHYSVRTSGWVRGKITEKRSDCIDVDYTDGHPRSVGINFNSTFPNAFAMLLPAGHITNLPYFAPSASYYISQGDTQSTQTPTTQNMRQVARNLTAVEQKRVLRSLSLHTPTMTARRGRRHGVGDISSFGTRTAIASENNSEVKETKETKETKNATRGPESESESESESDDEHENKDPIELKGIAYTSHAPGEFIPYRPLSSAMGPLTRLNEHHKRPRHTPRPISIPSSNHSLNSNPRPKPISARQIFTE